jgi:hemerythrin-like domain-containing protein
MKTNSFRIRVQPGDKIENPRREFLKNSLLAGSIVGISGLSLVSSCKKEEGEEVTPVEDLMREHGVLNRIMLVYDTCIQRLQSKQQFPIGALNEAALIIKSFIESYHEKLEENHLFPRFTKANILVDLVQTLYIQHSVGRKITEQIIQLGNSNTLENVDEMQKLSTLLGDFNRMYRPHEAREDTVLFPMVKKIIVGNEYFSMGEDFEKKEHELFGQEGFEGIVTKVEGIEKQLGIFDISAFTPVV